MTFRLHLRDIYYQEWPATKSSEFGIYIDPACDAGHRTEGDGVQKSRWIAHNNAPFTWRTAIIGSVR